MTYRIKSLADGQLTTTKTALYTAGTSTQAVSKKITLVNTSPSMIKVNLYFLESGGTSRHLIPYDMELAGYYSAIVDDEQTLEEGDAIQGDASVSNVIDYTISGVENI